jgi:hypothetical protein
MLTNFRTKQKQKYSHNNVDAWCDWQYNIFFCFGVILLMKEKWNDGSRLKNYGQHKLRKNIVEKGLSPNF